MMEQEFNFDKVGKQMPYKVPADFFDKITKNTLAEAERRNTAKKQPAILVWRVISVAASVLILFSFGYYFYTDGPVTEQAVNTTTSTKQQTTSTEEAVIEQGTKLKLADPATLEQQVNKSAVAVAPKVTEAIQKGKPTQIAENQKTEDLDDVLQSLTDEELLILASIAETDLSVYNETL